MIPLREGKLADETAKSRLIAAAAVAHHDQRGMVFVAEASIPWRPQGNGAARPGPSKSCSESGTRRQPMTLLRAGAEMVCCPLSAREIHRRIGLEKGRNCATMRIDSLPTRSLAGGRRPKFRRNCASQRVSACSQLVSSSVVPQGRSPEPIPDPPVRPPPPIQVLTSRARAPLRQARRPQALPAHRNFRSARQFKTCCGSSVRPGNQAPRHPSC
jgi:hypothetical protein